MWLELEDTGGLRGSTQAIRREGWGRGCRSFMLQKASAGPKRQSRRPSVIVQGRTFLKGNRKCKGPAAWNSTGNSI